MGKDDTDGSQKAVTMLLWSTEMIVKNADVKHLSILSPFGGWIGHGVGILTFSSKTTVKKKMNSSYPGQNKSKSFPGVSVVKFPSNPLPA